MEYIAYLPEGDEVTVDLSAALGIFTVEWMQPVEGTMTPGGTVKGGGKPNFAVPFPVRRCSRASRSQSNLSDCARCALGREEAMG